MSTALMGQLTRLSYSPSVHRHGRICPSGSAAHHYLTMDMFDKITEMGGVARVRELLAEGFTRHNLHKDYLDPRLIRIRQGTVCSRSLSLREKRALSCGALLTCSSAAHFLGLPTPPNESAQDHWRTYGRRELPQGVTNHCRRYAAPQLGACVYYKELIHDYSDCNTPEWTLALLDAIARERRMTRHELTETLRTGVEKIKRLAALVDSRSESALESIVRYRLHTARIPHKIQVPIGTYRADFVLGSSTVLEAHGAEHHAGREQWEADRSRVLYLRSRGFDVIEITWTQVWTEWERIEAVCKRAAARAPRTLPR